MPRLAYVSFDQVPAAKGASTHIEAFVRGLAAEFGSIDLITVAAGRSTDEPCERWPGVMHCELPALGVSLIERVLYFRGFLTRWLQSRQYDVIHFRSIFEGLPILKFRNNAALVFEVNGLHSIELKYRYPGSEDDAELMRKLEAQERICVAAADRIVTPSAMTRDFLANSRGAVAGKVVVIPNGVDTELLRCEAASSNIDSYRLLYFGTLSSWQGVDVAIRAIAKVDGTFLTVLGPGSGVRRNALSRLAAKLGVANRVAIRPAVSQRQLARELVECDAVVAPLLWNDRNVLQGCCPLKVLEGMAAGRPVIASDLPVVHELGTHEQHLLLTGAGSVDSVAAAIVRLRSDAALAARLGANARRLIEQRFTWAHAITSLVAVYEDVMLRSTSRSTSQAAHAPARN